MSFPTDWLQHHRQADCLTILPMSFILGTQSRQCSKLTSNFHHHIVCLERQLRILRWHLIYGYSNLLLHHSLDVMSSPIDYIFLKPLDKCAVIIISILTSSETYIEFLMRNSMLAPSMNWVNIDNIIAFPPTQNLFLFCVVPWVPYYPTYVMLYLGVLPSFMSRMLWEFHHLLRILGIVILLAMPAHSRVPVLILTRMQIC